jgi:hypothetical protein
MFRQAIAIFRRPLCAFYDVGVELPTAAHDGAGFKPVATLRAFAKVRRTEAGSIWRIKGPCSAPRLALKD